MTRDPIARLRRTGETLDPDLRQDLLALGADLVPGLTALLRDRCVAWGRRHAVDILVDLRAHEAIPAMLDAASGDLPRPQRGRAGRRRTRLLPRRQPPRRVRPRRRGADARIPVRRDGDLGALYAASGVLARLGIKDERIFQAILKVLAADHSIGTSMLLEYGDERAVQVIERAIFDVWLDMSRGRGFSTCSAVTGSSEVSSRRTCASAPIAGSPSGMPMAGWRSGVPSRRTGARRQRAT